MIKRILESELFKKFENNARYVFVCEDVQYYTISDIKSKDTNDLWKKYMIFYREELGYTIGRG